MAKRYAQDQAAGFSNRIEKVAIVGAGGQIGRFLTEALLKTGKHTVTAISRPTSDNKLPEGVHVVKVDYSGDDNSALVEALQGQQFLIITMAVGAPPDTINKLIRAAAKAGVPYVLPNWFGFDPAADALNKDTGFDKFRDSVISEIKNLGVSSYILLTCNIWYEFSLGGGPNRYGFDFKERTFVMYDNGDVPINHSTWPLCAKAVANLLSLKELPDDANDQSTTLAQFANGPVYVSSFRLSQRDMFESVKRVTKTSDSDWKITHESTAERFQNAAAAVQGGDTTAIARFLYSRMFFPNGGGDFESKRSLDNNLLGLEAENLDEFTAEGIRIGLNDEVVSRAHG